MSEYIRSKVAGGTYFFTVALADRHSNVLTTHISHLRAAYRRVQILYPFNTLAICILPDHLHAVWQLPEGDDNFALRWQHIKGQFSRRLIADPQRSDSKLKKREKGIWQRRYWEHQIRDDIDLQRHVDYTHINPVKHGYVAQVKDWQYSSFHQCVQRGELPLNWSGGKAHVANYGE